MKYRITFVPRVERDLRKLERRIQRRLLDAITLLANDPRPQGVAKMAGSENLWRIRIGQYRIMYEIHDIRLVVLVVRIGHHKDVYRKGR